MPRLLVLVLGEGVEEGAEDGDAGTHGAERRDGGLEEGVDTKEGPRKVRFRVRAWWWSGGGRRYRRGGGVR